MERNTAKAVRFHPDTGEPLPPATYFTPLAQDLVESARGQGVEFTAPNGLLTELTRQVLQDALEVEMADHLGYDKHDFEGRNGLDSRNVSTPERCDR